jgi:hypothetical protein
MKAKMIPGYEAFDYADLHESKTIFIRMNEIAMFCILNDSCGTWSLMKDGLLSKITGPLSPIQLREVMARLAHTNTLIRSRPQFWTEINDGKPRISATVSATIETTPGDPRDFGSLMYRACAELIRSDVYPDRDKILEHIKEGRWTFLFDSNGNFLTD